MSTVRIPAVLSVLLVALAALLIRSPASVPAQAEEELTQVGTPIAKVTAPTGGGSKNIETIRDGVRPVVGSTSSLLQYDTFDGGSNALDDWIGYSFANQHTFTRMEFQEGRHFLDSGGWFVSLTVQVRNGGVWQDVSGLVSLPAYPGVNDGVNFESYSLTFAPMTGDGIRLYGAPGGPSGFISVAELGVFGMTGSCGDGIVSPGEQCDAGGQSSSCDSDCTFAVCGDGTLNPTAGEACDDGNAVDGDGCDSDCAPTGCGDGVAVFPEECDDANSINGDGCSFACLLEDERGLCAGVSSGPATSLNAVLVASGLGRALDIQAPPLDPHRLFVATQTGEIRLIKNGTLLPQPFLDVSSLTTCCGERGLLGLAFHPDYENNRRFFVHYTNPSGNNVIARYDRSVGDPDVADFGSGVVLFTVTQPGANHQGGQLAFGPDGYLYTAIGDGGGGSAGRGAAQADDSLLGKVLRIDVDVDAPPYYAVPPDNPGTAGAPLGLIWGRGLRNPWRFSFDRANGDLYIADVGEVDWEEINYEPAASIGANNFGWPIWDGDSNCFQPIAPADCDSTAGYEMPLYAYDHSFGCSVTGGYVYRGCAMPSQNGRYFFGDYCSARVFSFVANGQTPSSVSEHTAALAPGGGISIAQISAFGQDARGEIYIADLGGEVFRIVPAAGVCGDGIQQTGEQCDDAGQSVTCDADCTFAVCGDGSLNTAAGESCDDGNGTSGDGCDANCTPTGCGNAIVTLGESCDTGGESASCDADCSAAVCGDGTLNLSAGELCDDGNTLNGDGCSSQCVPEVSPTVCGDANSDDRVTASDGLIILKNSVGQSVACPDFLCDADGNGLVSASDANIVLQTSVGLGPPLNCPAMPGILFSLESGERLGALQVSVDYATAPGDFDGTGGGVLCQSLISGATASFNKAPGRFLNASIASVTGFQGPKSLFYCDFTAAGSLAPSQFVVAVVDAVDIADRPVAPFITVRVP